MDKNKIKELLRESFVNPFLNEAKKKKKGKKIKTPAPRNTEMGGRRRAQIQIKSENQGIRFT